MYPSYWTYVLRKQIEMLFSDLECSSILHQAITVNQIQINIILKKEENFMT